MRVQYSSIFLSQVNALPGNEGPDLLVVEDALGDAAAAAGGPETHAGEEGVQAVATVDLKLMAQIMIFLLFDYVLPYTIVRVKFF